MYALIPVIIGLALLSAFSATIAQYVPISALRNFKAREVAIDGFKRLELSTLQYIDNNRDSETGVPVLPVGVTDTQSLHNDMFPFYGFLPSASYGFNWLVTPGQHLGMPAIGICLDADPDFARNLFNISKMMPQGSTTQGSNCNSTDQFSNGKALTYWVVLDHYAQEL